MCYTEHFQHVISVPSKARSKMGIMGDPGRAAGLRRQSGHCPPSWETLGEPQTLGKPQTMGKPQGSEGNRGTEGMPTLAPRQAAGLRRQSGH